MIQAKPGLLPCPCALPHDPAHVPIHMTLSMCPAVSQVIQAPVLCNLEHILDGSIRGSDEGGQGRETQPPHPMWEDPTLTLG